MSCILHIETTTEVCSVALSQDGACIFHKEYNEGMPSHTTLLAPMVEEALAFIDSRAIPLEYVAVSCGPGSYTGLRIGVSMAKGVCYGRNAKLIAIPTLQLLCVPLLLKEMVPANALLCPMIDARRMEVYTALYDIGFKEILPTQALVITPDTFADQLAKNPIYFFGNGAAKCQEILTHPNAVFLPNIVPLAKHSFPLAEQRVAREQFEDIAYFEPFYLKEFITTSPKKTI